MQIYNVYLSSQVDIVELHSCPDDDRSMAIKTENSSQVDIVDLHSCPDDDRSMATEKKLLALNFHY